LLDQTPGDADFFLGHTPQAVASHRLRCEQHGDDANRHRGRHHQISDRPCASRIAIAEVGGMVAGRTGCDPQHARTGPDHR
jgi:hypothetical protein